MHGEGGSGLAVVGQGLPAWTEKAIEMGPGSWGSGNVFRLPPGGQRGVCKVRTEAG